MPLRRNAPPAWTGLMLAALLAAPPAMAAQQESHPQSAVTVVRDPETGQLRAPTAEEAKALRDAAPKAARRLPLRQAQQRVLPHGGVMLEVDESMDSYSVAVRRSDGSLQTQCVTGESKAKHIVKSGKTAVKKAHDHQHGESGHVQLR